jgi:hypothetical protein
LVVIDTRNKTPPSTPDISELNERSFDGFSLLHFTPEEGQHLREALAPLLSRQCTDMFARAGLQSPSEVARTTGVEMRYSRDLYMYSADQLGLVSEETRSSLMKELSNGRTQSGSVPPVRYGKRLTTDGRARIFLPDNAFVGESFWFGTISLRGVLIHEFIHVGGQPPTPGWMGFLSHDLAGYEHYDEIMSACGSV